MSTVRVRDLATQLEVTSKEIIKVLKSFGGQAKGPMSILSDEDVTQIKNNLSESTKSTSEPNTAQISEVIVRRKRTTESLNPESMQINLEDKTEIEPIKEKNEVEVETETESNAMEKTSRPKNKSKIIETPKAKIIAPIISPALEKIDISVEEHLIEKDDSIAEKIVETKIEEKQVIRPDNQLKKPHSSQKTPPKAPKVVVISKAPIQEPEKNVETAKQITSARQNLQNQETPPTQFQHPRVEDENKKKSKSGGSAAIKPATGGKAVKKDLVSKYGKQRIVEAAELYNESEHTPNLNIPVVETPARRPTPKRKQRKKDFRHEIKTNTQPIKQANRKVRVDENIRLADFAQEMGVKANVLIKTLFSLGTMATINQSIDFETAQVLASEFDYEIEKIGFSENTFLNQQEIDTPESLRPRPPVVTIMGHVDHGKTSLLDAIRKTSVVDGEAGGITQHIGAYHVNTSRGDIVFLDTPGHEAFTSMRSRGAQITDIVILVVAADDGVKTQTREAISHAKAAGVPVIVAVNKIDKQGADLDRVKRELAECDLVAEDWGGETIFAYVSAKEKQGLDTLLELILLQAEVLELKANPEKPGFGHIVEAQLDKGRGPVATVLTQTGTIRQGDAFVCGIFSGKIRTINNDQGRQVKEVGPSMPAEIIGFDGVPEAGDEFFIVADEKVARKIAESRRGKQRDRELAGAQKVTLESFLATKPDAELHHLNLVVKADVQGSLEAILEALRKLETEEVKISIVHSNVGAITESDVMLAATSQAIVIGFNIKPPAKIKQIADREHVDIRFYNIIYKLVDEIKSAMGGLLSPDITEKYLGQADVRQTFSVPKFGTIAGAMVSDGKLSRNSKIRLIRDGVVIYTGVLTSLKRFKEDAKEVTKGYECGMGLENYDDIKIGDIIESFELIEEARTL